MLPVPTVTDLALFSGRPENSYPAYAAQALQQATLMFSVATGLDAWPADPDLVQIGINAILEMADRLILEQPFQLAKASPYQTETIGSYSYSKGYNLARATASGIAASENLGIGLYWWSIALDLLRQKGMVVTASGSISVHTDGLQPDHRTGGLTVENPTEQYGPERPPYIRIS